MSDRVGARPGPLDERLSKLDTGAISDALDKLAIEGVVLGLKALTVPKRIAGRVVTVALGAARGEAPKRHLGTAAIEAAGPGDVVVVEHNKREDCAGWGGILSLAAATRGLVGTIVDGAARDIDESRELGYPVYARAAVPRTARGRVVERAWNIPVTIGGVHVDPGDLVVADASGVVFVPKARLDEVLSAAEAIVAREASLAEAVRSGKPVSEVMGGDYEWMTRTKP